MKRIIKIFIVLAFLFIVSFQILNNGLDLKYHVEPFEYNGNPLGLVELTKEKLINNSTTLFFTVILFLSYLLLNLKQGTRSNTSFNSVS